MTDTAAFLSAVRMVLTADDDKTQQVFECVQYVEHMSEQLQALGQEERSQLGLPTLFQGLVKFQGLIKSLRS
jgi:hypothetical protein